MNYKNHNEKESDTGSFYNETVLDHFTNPRNIGEMTESEADGFSVLGKSGPVLKFINLFCENQFIPNDGFILLGTGPGVPF